MALDYKTVVTFLLFLPAALAVQAAGGDIAISGYSPVSYLTEGKAEPGSPRFSVFHEGRIYFLRSEEQVQRFRSMPARYIPVVAGHCPYSLALGRSVAVDPERFKVIDGRVYLFHDAQELDALEASTDAAAHQGTRKRSDPPFVLFRF